MSKLDDFIAANPLRRERFAEDWIPIFRDLTGACEQGSKKFIRNQQIVRYKKYNTLEFLYTVRNTWGKEIIEELITYYEKVKEEEDGQ